MTSTRLWPAIVLMFCGAMPGPAAERIAHVRLAHTGPFVTSDVVLLQVHSDEDVRKPYVAVLDGPKTPFAEMRTIVFTVTDRKVSEDGGEYEVEVEIVLRRGSRVTGLLDREGADTLSLQGQRMKVHLTTFEWTGHQIRVDFEENGEPR